MSGGPQKKRRGSGSAAGERRSRRQKANGGNAAALSPAASDSDSANDPMSDDDQPARSASSAPHTRSSAAMGGESRAIPDWRKLLQNILTGAQSAKHFSTPRTNYAKNLLEPMSQAIERQLERAENPLVRIGLYGKPGAGKSYIICRLIGLPIASSLQGGVVGCTLIPGLYTLRAVHESSTDSAAAAPSPVTSLCGFQFVAVFCTLNEYQHRMQSSGLGAASPDLLATMRVHEERGEVYIVDKMPEVCSLLERGFRDLLGDVAPQPPNSAEHWDVRTIARAIAAVTVEPLSFDHTHAISHFHVKVPASCFLSKYNVELMDLSGFPDPNQRALRQLLIRHVAPSLDIVCITYNTERAQVDVEDAISMQQCGLFTRMGPLPKLIYLSNRHPPPDVDAQARRVMDARQCLTQDHALEIAIAVAFNIDVESMHVFPELWTDEHRAAQMAAGEKFAATVTALDHVTKAIAEREQDVAALIRGTRSMIWLDEDVQVLDPADGERYLSIRQLGDAVVEKRQLLTVQRLREASETALILLTEAKSVVKGKQLQAMAIYISAVEKIVNNESMTGVVSTKFVHERQRRGNLEFITEQLSAAFDTATQPQDDISLEFASGDEVMVYMARVWRLTKDTFLTKLSTSVQQLALTAQKAINSATLSGVKKHLDKSVRAGCTAATLIKVQTMMAGVWDDSVRASTVSSLARSLFAEPSSIYDVVQTTPPDLGFTRELFALLQAHKADGTEDVNSILRKLLISSAPSCTLFDSAPQLKGFSSHMYAAFVTCVAACAQHILSLGNMGLNPSLIAFAPSSNPTAAMAACTRSVAAASSSSTVKLVRLAKTSAINAIQQMQTDEHLDSAEDSVPAAEQDWQLASKLQQYMTLLKQHVMDRSHEQDTFLQYSDWWKPAIIEPNVFQPARSSVGIKLPDAPPDPRTLAQAAKDKTFAASCQAIKQAVQIERIKRSTLQLVVENAAQSPSSFAAPAQSLSAPAAASSSASSSAPPAAFKSMTDKSGRAVHSIRFRIGREVGAVRVTHDIIALESLVQDVVSAAAGIRSGTDDKPVFGVYPIFVCSRMRDKRGGSQPDLHLGELHLARESSQPLQSLLFLMVEAGELHLYEPLVSKSSANQVVLLIVPDANLGIGRKRKLCMLTAEYFRMPYFFLMDDDLQFHEYSPIVCRPVPGSFSFVRACVFLQAIMQDAMCSTQPEDVAARADTIKKLMADPEVLTPLTADLPLLQRVMSIATNKEQLESTVRDPAVLLSMLGDATKQPKFAAAVRGMMELNLNRLASVSTWNIQSGSQKSYHQRLGDARRPTHCVSSVRFQFTLFNRTSVHGLHPVDDDALFEEPLMHKARVAMVAGLSSKDEKDKSKFSAQGLEAARTGIKFSDSIYNYKLLLEGKSGFQSIYFSHRDVEVRSLVNGERSELSATDRDVPDQSAPEAAAAGPGPLIIPIRRPLNLSICFTAGKVAVSDAVVKILCQLHASEKALDRMETETTISASRTRHVLRMDGAVQTLAVRLAALRPPLIFSSDGPHGPHALYEAVASQLCLRSNTLEAADPLDANGVKASALEWLQDVAEDAWIQHFFLPILQKMTLSSSLRVKLDHCGSAHSSRKRRGLWHELVNAIYGGDDRYGDHLICVAIANALSMSVQLYSSQGDGADCLITPNTGLARGHIKLGHAPNFAFLSVTAEEDAQAPQESDDDTMGPML